MECTGINEIRKLNITVVGLGLIGGSYAMAIRKNINPQKLWGIDIDTKSLQYAKEQGIIDEGFTYSKIPIQNSDFVIICLYPRLTVKFIKDNMKNFKPGAVITDTCGLKEPVIAQIDPVLRDDIDFIGGHPLAGNEGRGIKWASDDLFTGTDYILTPNPKNKEKNIARLKGIILKIGCANIIEMNPKDHDWMIGYASHLPHIIAMSLVLNPVIKEKNFYTGRSFRDATRVAGVNVDLWKELLIENRQNIIDHLDAFEANIQRLKELIFKKDESNLRQLLKNARSRKEEFDNAHTDC